MSIPPLFSLCRCEIPLRATGLLNHVVELLGDGADVLLASHDHLLNGNQRSISKANNRTVPARGSRCSYSSSINRRPFQFRGHSSLHILAHLIHLAHEAFAQT